MDTEIKEYENYLAKLIAAIIRNQLDTFHCKYLSDEQMKELNPIIRNSVYTALVKIMESPELMSAYYNLYVPEYWEDCELVKL